MWNTRCESDFDAQRLRADTAEAELKRLDNLDTMQLIAELTKRNAAAEQRISDTVAKLQLAADMLDDDERGNRFAQVLQLAIAALNPNPEEESHEMAREALKMENQRIVPARFKCLACGEYHEGSGNLPCPKMLATSVTLKTGAYKKRED